MKTFLYCEILNSLKLSTLFWSNLRVHKKFSSEFLAGGTVTGNIAGTSQCPATSQNGDATLALTVPGTTNLNGDVGLGDTQWTMNTMASPIWTTL